MLESVVINVIWTAPTRSVAGSAIVEVDVFNITSGEAVMSEITTVGIDLAKNVLSVHGVDARGKAVLRKTLSRASRSS